MEGEPFQVDLSDDPFGMLVACQLVNRTRWAGAADRVHAELVRRWPTAERLRDADPESLRPLGLQKPRADNLIAMAEAWDNGCRTIRELPGCGKYADDSYAIFVTGEPGVAPEDAVLKAYLAERVGDVAPLVKWAGAREDIRLRRAAGEPPPWTDDPVLARYRFCNVRREDDRVTAWVRREVRERFAGNPNLWFMLLLCRLVNWPPTLNELIAGGAWPERDWNPAAFTEVLEARKLAGEKVWTGAYIIKSESSPGARSSKADYVARTLTGAWEARAAVEVAFSLGLAATHAELLKLRGLGPFLAYQAVVDMRFTSLLSGALDLRWASAGPGTLRGLNRLHGRTLNYPTRQRDALIEMRAKYPYLRRAVPGTDFSDVPNALCETDKMLRALNGEGAPKALYCTQEGEY